MIDSSERKYCLYVHTTPSLKKYVGITNRRPQDRWRKDGKGYRNNEHFFNAIQKYGWDNIDHNVLADNLTKDEAIEAEKELIARLKTTDKQFGYNHSLGGECPSNNMADVEAYRLKQAMISHELWNNPKFRERAISKRKPPVNHTPSSGRKAVIQMTMDGEFIARYDCIRDACKAVGTSVMNVSRACNGKAKHACGFKWMFENPDDMKSGRGESTKKKVSQYSIDGELIARFDSATEAVKSLGFGCVSTLCCACRGKTKTAYGYRWQYEDR